MYKHEDMLCYWPVVIYLSTIISSSIEIMITFVNKIVITFINNITLIIIITFSALISGHKSEYLTYWVHT